MRYLTGLIKPEGETAFHPLGRELTDDPSIEREAIHHIELLDDDTVLLLAEASGSKERYEQIMEESPHVVGHLTAGDGRWMAVSQLEPTDTIRRSLELQRESLLVIETPIRFTSEDHLNVTYIGTDEIFSELYEYAREAERVEFEILRTGDYDADESPLNRVITERQEEVLEAAVDLGYYGDPRRASLEDIGEVVGISPGTAGEHLRKTEERVFTELVH